jgi:deazaflavin-dependent oxidoreductase (nitroreductase family)
MIVASSTIKLAAARRDSPDQTFGAPTLPMTTTPTKLDPAILNALDRGHTIDITTTGRKSGEPRRIEIVFFNFGGRLYISGMPSAERTRAWLQNLRANPSFTFHRKQGVRADQSATAHEITEPVHRREVIEQVARAWRRDPDVMFAHSPLIEVTIDGYGAPAAG